jgi:hypothetical protein
MLEDENTQLKESLKRGEPSLSPLRAKGDALRVEAIERAWLEERRGLQLETDLLRERLKAAEERSKRDAGVIATLEGKLKDNTVEPSEMEGEDLNDEINTSRKDLYSTLTYKTNCRRLQVVRLEKELAAANAAAQFNKMSTDKG